MPLTAPPGWLARELELTALRNPCRLGAISIANESEVGPMFNLLRLAGLLALGFAVGCASSLGPKDRPPVSFRDATPPRAENAWPHWPVPAKTAEQLLAHGDPESREVTGAGGGTTGAEKHTLYFPSVDLEFLAKWKVVPGRLDGFNNAPRKEVAAYWIQRIFLDPEDYVAPTSVIRCAPLEKYRERHPMASATVDGTNCVLGALSIWVFDVTVPDELYEEERFLSDPQYAYFMSNLNLFTYLVDHRDGRDGNFLVAKDDSRRQVFAVDNGISFAPRVFNYFVPNWTKLRVAGLRKQSIDRLREVRREDLDFLAVASQLKANEEGILRTVDPSAPLDPDKGASARDDTVQFGLTTAEIDGVYARIQKLIEAVDAGRVPVF
jgi:hypothetical protein